jgi:hypothetical protein
MLDELNSNSRKFYERSKFKLILSIIFASFFLFSIGLLSSGNINDIYIYLYICYN